MESAAPAEVAPRPAATVLALRQAPSGFEVLMVRRAREARFMGGARVFPGGAVDPADHEALDAARIAFSGDRDEAPWRAAALRELAEEAGLLVSDPVVAYTPGDDVYATLDREGSRLAGDRLEYLSNWVTPRGLPIRFDARFFVVGVDGSGRVEPDRNEVYDPVWVSPADAIAAAEAGQWQVEIPTRFHLDLLAEFDTVEEVVEFARTTRPVAVEPTLVTDGNGVVGVQLPDGVGPS